ncbi:MAG: hypothetical protein DRO39_08285 [Thermoprotei archaeon]|nr:MAG: hypothetical protein DRO39_08285 [Thermoprotei archaeon]
MSIEKILEFAVKRAGVSKEGLDLLRREVERLLRERGIGEASTEQLLDAYEHVAMIWSSVDERWSVFAKYLLLGRIYAEAGKELPTTLPPLEERLTYQAVRLLYSRYLLRRPDGKVRETPDDAFRRTAMFVALAEARYGNDPHEYAAKFYEAMSRLRFLPNSPTLMNSATRKHQLAACFVVPLGDSMEEIIDALRTMVSILQTGAGTGFDFSPLRPRGDYIAGTGGFSSGPASFMKLFDSAAEVVKEGGKRRGALMGILHDWHPDVLLFVESKCSDKPTLEHFNISVAVHDKFMEAVEKGGKWPLFNPRTCPDVVEKSLEDALRMCEPWSSIDARELFKLIVHCAWRSGDPGAVFIDTVNRHNPTPALGEIRSTNPCGETPLLPWEACNLGSINLEAYVEPGRIKWDELAKDIELAVRFLDDVIDMSWYPDRRIEEAVLRTRKIGLGVMGLADALTRLGVRYDSHSALYLADKLMEFIAYHARRASNKLAKERRPYPEFPRSIHAKGRFNWEPQVPAEEIYDPRQVSDYVKELVSDRPPMEWENLRRDMMKGTRNASVTTIAPTGSISIIAGVNSSIEPFFALVYVRESTVGRFLEVNKHLRRALGVRGRLSRELLIKVARGDTFAVPPPLRNVLRTAHEIAPEWHVRMQAVFQRWVDNAVSKTVNLRHDASEQEVEQVFMLAWRLGCKGITVFRDKSKSEQVLRIGADVEEVLKQVPEPIVVKDKSYHRWFRIGKDEILAAAENYAGGCPTCEM